MANKARTITLWIVSTVLALMFLMSGGGKIANMETVEGQNYDDQFVHWGFPAWFRIPVGLLEVAGAVGLLVPRLRTYAAAGLGFLMLGAVFTHLRLEEYSFAVFPFILGAASFALGWFTRPTWIRARLARAQPA